MAKITLQKPEGLNKIGSAMWEQAVQFLGDMGLLAESDAPLIELLCRAWEAMRLDPNSMPAATRCHSLLKELGLTPAARAKCMHAAVDAEEHERFFAGDGGA